MVAALFATTAFAAASDADDRPWVCVMNADGQLMNDVGYPRVEGATVELYAPGSCPHRETPISRAVTGADGCVAIDVLGVPPRAARLRVSAAGYASTWAPLAFQRGDPFYVFGAKSRRVAWVFVHLGVPLSTQSGVTLDRVLLDALPGGR